VAVTCEQHMDIRGSLMTQNVIKTWGNGSTAPCILSFSV